MILNMWRGSPPMMSFTVKTSVLTARLKPKSSANLVFVRMLGPQGVLASLAFEKLAPFGHFELGPSTS